MINIRFTDFNGDLRQFSLPNTEIENEDMLRKRCLDGFWIDGSSLPKWQPVYDSDLFLKPDFNTLKKETFFRDFGDRHTTTILADVWENTKKKYVLDPRTIAKKTEKYAEKYDIKFGLEVEFFLLKKEERVEDPYDMKNKYLAVPPIDEVMHIKENILTCLYGLGFNITKIHHEVGWENQSEIALRHSSLLKQADSYQWLKYIISNIAYKENYIACFRPKPFDDMNGSGLHTNISINNKEFSRGHAICGLLEHAKSLCAITNPTDNSYERLIPNHEAPTDITCKENDRTAAIRLPKAGDRFEYRVPDNSCNIYFALSAITMAMIDGIENKLDIKDHAGFLPMSLPEAKDYLYTSHMFLKNEIFDDLLIKGFLY